MKVVSERWAIKYLLSDHGLCLGVDLKDRSYLFLLSSSGVVLERRPLGDRVVEDLDYEIPAIARALAAEHATPPDRP
ncbi:MAG TPA: hypothetical protein VEL82_07140 [Thermoplasmata archaeon]|nr:hypothetical protein [Thermoplasmata archaeon]